MKKHIWVGATALALMSAQAMAADNGFYVGAGAGVFGTDADGIEEEFEDFSEDDTGIRAFGGYQINKYFGVELGYNTGADNSATLGDIDVDGIEADIDLDVSGIDLFLTGTLPIGETFYAFAKAGMISWDAELDAVIREDDGEGGVITTPLSADDSGEDPAYGAGFGMNLGDHAKVQVDYTVYDFGDVDGDFLAASFVWKF